MSHCEINAADASTQFDEDAYFVEFAAEEMPYSYAPPTQSVRTA
jgi:hypothetical protein